MFSKVKNFINLLTQKLASHSLTLAMVFLVAIWGAAVAQASAKAHQPPVKTVKIQVTHAKTKTKPVAAPPTPPTPTPQPAPASTPKPALKSVATHSSRPAPVVTPAPTSNVSGLAPTDPTPSSSSGGSSGSTASSQQTTGYTSTNWSGYLATGSNFTAVSGAWTVPAATGNGHSLSADASWIGIGGVTSGDLIQVGTDNTVSRSGQLITSAFYELLPASSLNIPSLIVTAGDHMTAAIGETAPNQWSVTITDATTGQTYSTNVSYASSHSSAEWIEEDPSFARGSLVPFDHFGTASFSASAATGNGSTLNLNGLNAQPITMVNSGGQAIATPSAIIGGAAFTVSGN